MVVTSVIMGAKHTDQIDDPIVAIDKGLSVEEIAGLNKVSALPCVYQTGRPISWARYATSSWPKHAVSSDV